MVTSHSIVDGMFFFVQTLLFISDEDSKKLSYENNVNIWLSHQYKATQPYLSWR